MEKEITQSETQEKKNVKEITPAAAKKTAVLVGASSGIGRETALKLASKGYRVYNISRTALKGERVKSLTADAAQEGELQSAIDEIGAEAGNIDLLVYSAGFSMAAPLEHAKSGDYRYLFEVNYFGAIEAIRAAAPYLKKRGGRVILVGSMGGELPIPFDSFYSSSKAALGMLAREANIELNKHHVKVTAILPGGTATDFTYNRRVYKDDESFSYSPSLKKASAALANMEQGGMNPSLVADAVVKLSLRKNPPPIYVTGKKNLVMHYLYKLLPERVTDWAVKRKFNQK